MEPSLAAMVSGVKRTIRGRCVEGDNVLRGQGDFSPGAHGKIQGTLAKAPKPSPELLPSIYGSAAPSAPRSRPREVLMRSPRPLMPASRLLVTSAIKEP